LTFSAGTIILGIVPMPEPGSIIPSSGPVDLVSALARSAGAGAGAPAAALLAFQPSVSEAEFLKHFPLPFRVEAVTIYEAQRKKWKTDRSYWQFIAPFQYVSDTWGPIDIPKGFYTDFASVPPNLHSVIDDDSPVILFPSAPHDFLFTTRKDKGNTRGWITDTKQLTLTEVNRVLTEAMSLCGANLPIRELVFSAVELANEGIRNEFAP
jgi:hypothetical protein